MPVLHRLLLCLLGCAAVPVLAHQGAHQQLEFLAEQIARDPGSQQLYLKRGRLYAEMEHFDQARADFDRAAQLGPADFVAFDYGVLCFSLQDMDCALRELDRHIEAYPQNAAAFEARSRVYQARGETRAALADLERYFALAAQPPPGLYVTASKLAEEIGAPGRGLGILDAGIARLGVVPQLQRRAVEMELGLGNTAGAVARWASCREVLRDSVDWKIEMARLYAVDGDKQQAEVLLAEAQTQLAGLRPTPARERASESIQRLQAQLRAAG